jgi:hypothetical protein
MKRNAENEWLGIKKRHAHIQERTTPSGRIAYQCPRIENEPTPNWEVLAIIYQGAFVPRYSILHNKGVNIGKE